MFQPRVPKYSAPSVVRSSDNGFFSDVERKEYFGEGADMTQDRGKTCVLIHEEDAQEW